MVSFLKRILLVLLAVYSLSADAIYVPPNSLSWCGGALNSDAANSLGWFQVTFGVVSGIATANCAHLYKQGAVWQVTNNKNAVCGCIHYYVANGGPAGEMAYADNNFSDNSACSGTTNPVYQGVGAPSTSTGVYGSDAVNKVYDSGAYFTIPTNATGKYPAWGASQTQIQNGYMMCREY